MLFLAPYLLLLPAVTALPQPQVIGATSDFLGGLGLPDMGGLDELIEEINSEPVGRWTSKEKSANTNVGISQHQVDWGNMKPWLVVKDILEVCFFNGCAPESKITKDTIVITENGGSAENGKITVTADGLFEEQSKKASIEGLVDLAAVVLEELSVMERRSSRGINNCQTNGQCDTIGGVKDSTQYRSPDAIVITVKDKDLEGSLLLRISVDKGSGADECQDIASIGGAIAGEVGAWGAPFSIASLVCNAL